MKLTLKKDEETSAPIVTEEGKIVYVDDDGNDLPLDPAAMYTKIADLGKQNKADRNNYTAIRNKFKAFEDVEDIDDWKTKADAAIETVTNFEEKDWLEASKVEALKATMKEGYDEKLAQKDVKISALEKDYAGKIEGKDSQIRTLMISTKFAGSPFFTGAKKTTTLNPEIAEAYFGKHFRVEQENEAPILRAYDASGHVINSKLNPGEPADFDEAMGFIIDAYPAKDTIMVSSDGGSGGGGGGNFTNPNDELAVLQKQHKDALAAGQTTTAVSLKNKIFELQQTVNG